MLMNSGDPLKDQVYSCVKRSTETVGQTDIYTCIVSEQNNQHINV